MNIEEKVPIKIMDNLYTSLNPQMMHIDHYAPVIIINSNIINTRSCIYCYLYIPLFFFTYFDKIPVETGQL